jgi:hypothetical protein
VPAEPVSGPGDATGGHRLNAQPGSIIAAFAPASLTVFNQIRLGLRLVGVGHEGVPRSLVQQSGGQPSGLGRLLSQFLDTCHRAHAPQTWMGKRPDENELHLDAR